MSFLSLNEEDVTIDFERMVEEYYGPNRVIAEFDESREFKYGARVTGGTWTAEYPQRIKEMKQWCFKNIDRKSFGDYHASQWSCGVDGKFWFSNENDLALFLLRWS